MSGKLLNAGSARWRSTSRHPASLPCQDSRVRDLRTKAGFCQCISRFVCRATFGCNDGAMTRGLNRRLRVTKWLGTIPAIATCTYCNRIFRVPLTALQKGSDARASLSEQFERHSCEHQRSYPSRFSVRRRFPIRAFASLIFPVLVLPSQSGDDRFERAPRMPYSQRARNQRGKSFCKQNNIFGGRARSGVLGKNAPLKGPPFFLPQCFTRERRS